MPAAHSPHVDCATRPPRARGATRGRARDRRRRRIRARRHRRCSHRIQRTAPRSGQCTRTTEGPPVISRRPSVEEMTDSSGGPPLPQRRAVWSIYGAKRAQPVATGRKWLSSENGSNKPIGNRWQPTATVSERMVRRGVISSSLIEGFTTNSWPTTIGTGIVFCAQSSHP